MSNTASNAQNIEDLEPLPTTPEALMERLKDLGIAFTLYEHKPVFTVAESESETAHIPGTHCRNLFLRDKKKKNFLVTAANETEIDLKKLSDVIESGRLSFGSGDRLWQHLGIRQGSVNPFCVVNDPDGQVTLILDAKMMAADLVAYHPMDNALTLTLTPADLLQFLDGIGHHYQVTDLSAAAPDPQ